MDHEHRYDHREQRQHLPYIDRSSSSSSSSSSVDHDQEDHRIHAPTPTRPPLPSRASSGPLVVHTDSSTVCPLGLDFGLDTRTMSPRRTREEIEALEEEVRAELKRHAKALQKSLLTIFHRIEAVREEQDKLDNNNKFLQIYVADLMATSKITAFR